MLKASAVSVEEARAAGIDLMGSSFYASSLWLDVGDIESDGRCGVVLVRVGDKLIAHMPYWIADGWESSSRRPDIVLAAAGVQRDTYVIAGSPSAYWSEMTTIAGHDPIELAGAVIDCLRSLAGSIHARGCIALYCEPRTTSAMSSALGRTDAVLLDGNARIDVPEVWSAFPENASRSRRQSIHREWRKFSEAGYQVSICDLRECFDEYLHAQVALERTHDEAFDANLLTRNLRAQVEAGAASSVFAVRHEGELVCASLFYEWGNAMTVRAFGAHRERSRSSADYFAATYYLPIQHAIAAQLRYVDVGISTLGVKASRGAVIQALSALDLSESPLWESAQAQVASRQAIEREPVLVSSGAIEVR